MDDRAKLSGEAAARRQLDRVGAFSDGVFAVAITLLVLNIEVPDVPNNEDRLADALNDLVPDLQAYFIAFAVIGLFWFGHHVAWSRFTATTRPLVWANLLLLSLIALMPFTTALMGKYDGLSVAVIAYAVNVGLAALADTFLDRIAYREGLVEDLSPAEIRAQMIAGWLRPAIFFLSIPIALGVSVLAAQLFWLLLFVTPRIARRLVGVAPAAAQSGGP